MKKLILCGLVTLSASTMAAEQPKPLAPLAFLAGHCWSSPFPDGKSTDTHCFEWVNGGHQLRDKHEVRAAGEKAAQYQGETLYLYDANASKIIYRYVDSTGGHSDGHVVPQKDGLSFPADTYIGADGKQIDFVTEWRRVDATTYEAKTRQKVGDGMKEIMAFRFSRKD